MSTPADAAMVTVLRKTGLLTDAQVAQVLTADRSDGAGLVAAIVRLGLVKEEELLQKLAPVLGLRRQNERSASPRSHTSSKYLSWPASVSGASKAAAWNSTLPSSR